MEGGSRVPAPRLASLSGLAVAPPDPAERESVELTKKGLVVAFVRVVLVTVALAGMLLYVRFQPPQSIAEIPTWLYALIGTTYALSLIYAALLRYRTLVVPLAHAQIALDALIVSVLVLMTGASESIFAFSYVIVVIEGSMMLYRRGAIVAVVSGFLTYGTILLLQVEQAVDYLPQVREGPALLAFVIQQVGMLVIAVLSSTLAEKARITGRRLAEKQSDLEQLEELHAAILRSLPAGLMTVDGSGVVRFANESALAILRLAQNRVVGATLEVIWPTMRSAWEKRRSSYIGEKGRERYEEPYARPDGSSIRIGFSFAPLSVGQKPGSIIVFQDLTDIVRLKEAVERAERLATVGKFAAGLAHEVRNPLAAMCASIDVLAASLHPPEPMQRLMSNIMREAERLNGLISDFLLFARPREVKLKEVDLSVLLQGVIDVFKNDDLMKERHVDAHLGPKVMAWVDEDLISQVVWNLVRNAAEAMSAMNRGTLTLEAHRTATEARIVIRDSGPGISQENQRRVFEPFFTTKQNGTGLGLAISHSIMEAHAGRIAIDSQEGRGTEVVLSFPNEQRAAQDSTDLDEVSDDIELIGGSFTEPISARGNLPVPPGT